MLRVPSPNRQALRHYCATLSVLILASTTPAIAAGPNVSTPAPTPVTPAAVTPSATQIPTEPIFIIDNATCAQQLTTAGEFFAQRSLNLSITNNAIDSAALFAEAGSSVIPLAGSALSAISILLQAGAQVASIASLVDDQTGLDITEKQNDLPFCDFATTGTVTVQEGGVNVTGVSIFNNDVGVDADINASGNVNANQVHAAQGISAHGGKIWLGDPNGTNYSDGITLGGGALSGAGFGGAWATTGHVSAIAIGNGANASSMNSLALGTGANATAVGATAIGQNAFASGQGSIAIGNAMSTGTNTIAIGTGAVATNSVAIGAGAMASGGGTAIGDFASANVGTNSAAFGINATVTRSNQQVFGTAANTYTIPGITSGASAAAQGPVHGLVTTDTSGNLASDGGALQWQVNTNAGRIEENTEGVAMAIAMTGSFLPQSGETFRISGNWGTFEGSNALSFGGALGLGKNVYMTGSFGAGLEEGTFGGRAGLSIGW